MKALRHIIKKEFIQIRRTRSMLAISLGVPVVQLLLLGLAVSTDVEHVPTVISDMDNSVTSRSLVSKLENTRYLDIQYRTTDLQEVSSLLQEGETILSVTIPSAFERDIVRGQQPRISLSADAQNTNVALTGAGYVRRIILSWVQQQTKSGTSYISAPSVLTNTIDIQSRISFNPQLKSTWYMVPGIMVLLVTIITIILTAMAIVREREIGTLEQLMVSPITRIEFILGKTLPFLILGMMELSIALLVIRTVYHVPIEGSLPLFLGISILFIFCTLGIGIFVSTIATTQQQALFTAWFILMFCILMSGLFLPLENMPKILYNLTYINPLRYFISIVRDLFLKGAGLHELWKNILALAVIGFVVMSAAITRFHKKME
ncbi:MAG: ABC transporter permease [Candidatus Latescibacteria bacterium]|nr:ABC transporter permease [Candidatus Latescibacterota bacterium]